MPSDEAKAAAERIGTAHYGTPAECDGKCDGNRADLVRQAATEIERVLAETQRSFWSANDRANALQAKLDRLRETVDEACDMKWSSVTAFRAHLRAALSGGME